MVLVNPNPLTAPLRVNPQTILNANQSAQTSGGLYQTPLVIQEINGYNTASQLTNTLSIPAQITLPYNGGQGTNVGTSQSVPIRANTLSVWALDETHGLWVKIPDSQVNVTGNSVTASISQFAVYALMGAASGDAQSVFVFPIPWRPNGPNAGAGAGQTGTQDGGMTFSNLPSECTIHIYTLAGNLVREIHHTDIGGAIGQEKWDGNTSGGAHAASGVYLWRVESASDSRTGKLMIIR
jgi:hypothetical protein